MLHILWLIIKCILILLGILVFLIFLAGLLLLFCPVRYRGKIKKGRSEGLRETQASGQVSWLFHGISVCIVLKNGNFETEFYILGIPLSKLKKFFHKNKKKTRPAKKQSPSSIRQNGSRQVPEEVPKMQISGKKTEQSVPITENKPSTDEIVEDDEKKHRKKITDLISLIWGKIRMAIRNLSAKFRNILQIPKMIQRKVRTFTLTIRKFCDKIKRWWEFINHPRIREAISFLWKKAKKLLHHVLPTRIFGTLTFGCEDPSITGTVLAVLGMTIPFHKNKVAITPVFTGENILEGEITLKGRIYGVVLLKTAAVLYFNKNIKYVIHRWRHKEVNHGERE